MVKGEAHTELTVLDLVQEGMVRTSVTNGLGRDQGTVLCENDERADGDAA